MPKKSVIKHLRRSLLETHEATPGLSRRGFLQLAAATSGTLVAGPVFAGLTITKERILSLYCPRLGETLRIAYWIPGEGYIAQSLEEINRIMRDYRNDEIAPIDPSLIDQMYVLQLRMDSSKPMHMLSGYRSPETNALLRKRSRDVAKHSLHMQGKAVDIRIPDRRVSDLKRAALSLKAGGVGYYPRSNFIHIDTGAVRTWK